MGPTLRACLGSTADRDLRIRRTRQRTSIWMDLKSLLPLSSVVSETGFISGTEGETSGYESEGGHSLSPTTPLDGSSSPPMGRRPRTAYTAEQINSLERAFKRNAYLGTRDKVELCKKLNLSDKQIRNWFQNRRMRMKRMVQDALAQGREK
uniref:Ventrally expressed dharma/bozozok antagonist n=1 Tax=Hucho hucho TaxID=62062 RepID=A0A4W5PIL8_9TELE